MTEPRAPRPVGEWQLDGEDVLFNPVVEEPSVEEPPEPPRGQFPGTAAAATAPPPLLQIVEGLLFVGGPPLTANAIATTLRIPAEDVAHAFENLARKYKAQARPYAVEPRSGGFVLAIRPQFRHLREKLFGGPREARLTQPALDVLALVAYRQPIAKPDIDAMRGVDSGAVLRQLVRLGLIAARRDKAVSYGTTTRFLKLFNLGSLDDLPTLGEVEPG